MIETFERLKKLKAVPLFIILAKNFFLENSSNQYKIQLIIVYSLRFFPVIYAFISERYEHH
jgi:hypothetical protein